MAVAKLKFTPKNHAEALAVLEDAGKSQVALAGNTLLTQIAGNEIAVSYHGNDIVRYRTEGTFISWAGWPTATTTGRIAQLVSERVNIIKGEPAINGVTVDSMDWHRVG